MSRHETAPLAGLLRVVFFLSVASIGLTTAIAGVTTLYEAPNEGEAQFESFDGIESIAFEENDETRDYNRNVGLIFGFIGIAAIAATILGLGSRHNPLRAGLLAGAVGLVFVAFGLGSDASDDWLAFLTTGLALVTLLGCSPWLDDGYPLQGMGGGGASASPPSAPSGPPQGGAIEG